MNSSLLTDMSGHNQELWKRNKPILQTDFLVREKIPTWLGNVSGKKILDAGCGEGYVARKLRDFGAIVEGFDSDPKMIELARTSETRTENPIQYRIGEIAEVDDLYAENNFDIAIISGVVCFLDEKQLSDCIGKLYKVIKQGGNLLVATNHTDSYFKRAKSHWLEYLTQPDPELGTQRVTLNFNHANGGRLFSGQCYFHTPKRIQETMQEAGFKVNHIYAPLASKEDMKHHPQMWGDENKIPYHLVVIGTK